MLRVDSVHAPEDELIHEERHLVLSHQGEVLLLWRRVGFAPSEDGILVVTTEILSGTEHSGIGEVDLRKAHRWRCGLRTPRHLGKGLQGRGMVGVGVRLGGSPGLSRDFPGHDHRPYQLNCTQHSHSPWQKTRPDRSVPGYPTAAHAGGMRES